MFGEFAGWNRPPSQARRISVWWQAADARLLLGSSLLEVSSQSCTCKKLKVKRQFTASDKSPTVKMLFMICTALKLSGNISFHFHLKDGFSVLPGHNYFNWNRI